MLRASLLAAAPAVLCAASCSSESPAAAPFDAGDEDAAQTDAPSTPGDAGATEAAGDAIATPPDAGVRPWVGPNPCPGAVHYVSPAGTATGDGSMNAPWDLATALASPAVKPGDLVWLRGGTYGTGGNANFTSSLSGASAAPICVRQFPGERATVNASLTILGSYVWYWGFELEITDWDRTTGAGAQDGVHFIDSTGAAVGNKVINMIVHDVLDGIADQQGASATEGYGDIVYNIGHSATDRGHGHCFYLQNATSVVKTVNESICYNAFDIGIQAYGMAAAVSHIHLDGNTVFNSGVPYAHRTDNVIVNAGAQPKADIVIAHQIAYNPLDAPADDTGYNILGDDGAVDLTVTDGYWIGATPSAYGTLTISGWQSLTFTGNTVVGAIALNRITTPAFSKNAYFNATPPAGVDPSSPSVAHVPTGVQVFVRPNFYELGRASIVVLNWDKQPTVDVDITPAGLTIGQTFEVRDVQSFFGTPAFAGTYDGKPIRLPMTLTETAAFVGFSPTPPHTSPEFNAFVVLPKP